MFCCRFVVVVFLLKNKYKKINAATKQRCKYTTSADIKNALEEVSHPAVTCDKSAVILLDSRE